MEQELVNEVYIFTKPNEIGMKFYDRSSESSVTEKSVLLSNGTFQTDVNSILAVRWDDEINGVNESRLIKTEDGSYTATTIMVSVEKMMKILESILVAEDQNAIIVNVRENEIKSADVTEGKKIK